MVPMMTFSFKEFSRSFWPLSRRGRWVAIIIVVAAALGAYIAFGKGGDGAASYAIVRGDFERQVAISGSVIAGQDAALGFAATGRVQGVYARAGERVSAGKVLAEIENGDAVASLERSQAALAKAEADLAEVVAGTRAEELAIAEAKVENAESSLAEAIRSAYTASDDAVYNRADAIFENSRTDPRLLLSISDATLENKLEDDRRSLEFLFATWKQAVDAVTPETAKSASAEVEANLAKVTAFLADANKALSKAIPDQDTSASDISADAASVAAGRSAVDAAASSLVSAVSELANAENDLALKEAGSTAEDIAASEALVASARAEVRSAQSALRKTRIVAPFAGIVTAMDIEVGEIVSPGTAGIAIQSDGTYQIETFIPEVAIADIEPGQHATTTLDAYSGNTEFPAVVVSVDPAETVKNGVPTYKTLLAFTTKDPRIRSGMTAEVRIVTGILEDAIVIPEGALGRDAEGAYVMIQVKKDKYERRAVETGDSPSLGQIEITYGLAEGEVISLAP